jgi:phosphatidylglycerol:prolipoprotein diacylglycerol transferase
MLQELFRIPGINLPIWSYGAMLVIGFLAALQLAKYLARRSGLDGEAFVNAGLLALVLGIIGARLSHVLENLGQYADPSRSFTANLLDALNLRSGGLTYYGGFILAFPVLVWYARKKRIPVRIGMDIVAPCLMIGLAFGRIGCFLNGCCYGAECELPWAVRYPYHSLPYQDQFSRGEVVPPDELTVPMKNNRVRLVKPEEFATTAGAAALARHEHSRPLHPAQLYSALTAFLIAGITLVYYSLPHVAGRGFALMLMLEGSTRFVLEMLRVEPTVWGTPFSLSMWLGLGLVALGAAMWIAFGRIMPLRIPAAFEALSARGA